LLSYRYVPAINIDYIYTQSREEPEFVNDGFVKWDLEVIILVECLEPK